MSYTLAMIAAVTPHPHTRTIPILHLYTGAVMRDLTVETTPEWYRPVLNQLQGNHPASMTPAPQGEDHSTLPLCLN